MLPLAALAQLGARDEEDLAQRGCERPISRGAAAMPAAGLTEPEPDADTEPR